jgi:hypothetical protein
MLYICINFKKKDIFNRNKKIKTMRTLTNIFDFAFFAAEADESLGRSSIVIS